MIQIKVCGIMRLAQAIALKNMGIDYVGFIFYDRSPRYVKPHISEDEIAKLYGIKKVGVFVNATKEEILSTADRCRLTMVQLHGDETPRFCETIAGYIPVIKAFRVAKNDPVETQIREYQEACDMFLFDTGGNAKQTTTTYGGTGHRFDWSQIAHIEMNKPFMLSGGIGMEHVANIGDFLRMPSAKNLVAVDVNSRFETDPGVKNLEQVLEFKTLVSNL